MKITNRNFYCLLRQGAFGERQDIEPMSHFKWERIMQMSVSQDVLTYIANGFMAHRDEEGVTLSDSSWNELENAISKTPPDVNSSVLHILQQEPEPSNIFIRHRYRSIIKKDDKSEDTCIEAQQLLAIIIYNINKTLTRGISLRGIIEMGRYLRDRGDRVDFVKLEHWLHQLGFVRMASLLGTVLIRIFNFSIDELPFMEKEELEGPQLSNRSLEETAHDSADDWHFRTRTNGMVENNNRVLRRNLRRSLRYLRYTPLETVSNFMDNFARSLSEIEE